MWANSLLAICSRAARLLFSYSYSSYLFCLSTPSVPYSLSINALPSLSLLSVNTFRSLFLVYECPTFLIPSVYQHLPFPVPCLSMLYLPYPFCLSTPSVLCSLSINALPSLSLLSINTFHSLFLVYQCSTFLIPSVYQHLPFLVPCLSMLYLPYPFCLSTPSIPCSLSVNALPSLSLLSINTFRSLFLVYQCFTFLIPSVYQHLPFPIPCLSMPYLPYPFCLSTPSLPYPFYLLMPPISFHSVYYCLPSLFLPSTNESLLLSFSLLLPSFPLHLSINAFPISSIYRRPPFPFLVYQRFPFVFLLPINASPSCSFHTSVQNPYHSCPTLVLLLLPKK